MIAVTFKAMPSFARRDAPGRFARQARLRNCPSVKDNTVFRAVIRQFGKFLIALSATDASPPVESASTLSESRARSDFGKQTRQLGQALKADVRQGKPATIVAGSVQFVGMEEVKRSLGPKWPSVAGIAYAIAEDSIRKHLTEQDAFGRHNEDTFIISFATLDKAEAKAKANAIVEEMRILIAEQAPEAGLSVDQTVADIEWSDAETQSIIDSIAAVLRKVREEAKAEAANLRSQFIREVGISYSPVWMPTSRVVLSYRVLIESEVGRHAFQRLTEVCTPEELKAVLFELDCVVIGRAVDALHRLVVRSGRAQLIIPVNFSTLDERSRREQYLSLCRDVQPSYKKLLFFHLQGVPQGVPPTRLSDITRALQPQGRGVLVDLPSLSPKAFDIIGASLHGIVIAGKSLPRSVLEATQRLTRLALDARESGLKVFVLGADTVGSVEAGTAAQVDCIEGRGIAPPRNEPKSAFQWIPGT